MSEEDRKEGLVGYYGLPGGREIALDIMTMLPEHVEIGPIDETIRTNKLLQSLEVVQYFHACDVPPVMDSEGCIRDGFHIHFELQREVVEKVAKRILSDWEQRMEAERSCQVVDDSSPIMEQMAIQRKRQYEGFLSGIA